MMKIATTGTNGHAKKRIPATLIALATLVLGAALMAPATDAQGSRKDDVVFGPTGHPVAGATVTVCQSAATGTPCSPLATVYTDATLTVPAPNPFQTDGIGNYHFYAPAGRYVVQISGPGITGTITYSDVILAPDVSSSGSGNNISAFGLTLGGNLSVAGNATINGALTAGIFAPSSLSISGNETVGGPRPRVDVTAYGAKGDGSTDDTAAIQAAINAACTTNAGGGAVTFPAPTGSGYVITQPQSPSNAAIFTIPSGCQGAGNGLSIVGGSGNWNQVTNGGGLPPMINVKATCGASPGLGPVLLISGSENVFLENVSLTGCNQAVRVDGTTNAPTWHFRNVNLSIQTLTGQGLCGATPTCLTDNVPLGIYNDIEGWYEGGAITNGAGYNAALTGPSILVAEENGATGNGSGLATFSNLHLAGGGSGGGVVADTRCNNGCSAAQNLHFIDVYTEGAGSTPFLTVQAENGNPNSAGDFYLEHVNASDNNPGTPCVSLNGASWYPDITIINSDCSNTSSPAVVVQNGTILGCLIVGNQFAGHSAVDASGNVVQGCTWQTNSGLDYTSGITSVASNYLGTNATTSSGFFGNTQSCPIGMTKSGDTNRSLCVDPFFGWGFGPGGKSGSGYDTRFYRNGNQSVALAIAQADGPTSPTATLAAGGTLTTGTYTITSITNISGSTEEVYCAVACYVALGQAVPISGNTNTNFNATVTVTVVKGPQVWDFTSGTPGNGTGGTFPSSYWYYLESTMVASNCAAANLTGPSREVNAAPVSGSQTINLAWTAGVGSAAGYCVWRGTAPGGENVYNYVSGQSTTSLSDTGGLTFTSGTPSVVNQTFPASPQFVWTPSALTVPSVTLGNVTSGTQCLHANSSGAVTGTGSDCGTSGMVYPGAGVANSTGAAWGTSYTVGTGANNLVQLNASAQLPAVSAALLTNFPTLNQNTTGTAANLTGCTPSTAGSVCYWNGSAWTLLAGNSTGTNWLQETSSGVPSWTAPGGGGTVTNVATTSPITGGPITTTGTIACATCVTSAAALTSNAVVIGGGGQASSTISTDSTTTHALFATAGAPAFRALALGDLPTGYVWNNLGAPSGNLSLAMAADTSIFTTTTAEAQMFAWKNTTAATVTTSQGSPVPAICGRAWHASADAEDCITFGELPGNGNDGAIAFTIGHTGTSTGLVTTSFPGPIQVTGTAGATASADGMFAYDSTGKITHIRTNAADSDAMASTTTDTTTTHAVFATAVAGVYGARAIATGDIPTLNQNTTGTAANLSGTPALPNGTTATTQTAASNDTKLATDAYVDGHFIANGTFTLNTAAVASGACETVVTVAATGVATTDVISVGFNGDPTAVTGYGASATGAVLSIYPYPTANNVNVKVCNSTSASITPSAMTLNWKVTR